MTVFYPCRCLPIGRIRPALRLWLLALLLAGAAGPTLAQDTYFRLKKPHATRATLPFELQRNLIIVPVMLNGRGPFQFMLDTGVGTSLITDPSLRDSLNLQRGQRYLVAGVGEEAPLEAYRTDNVRVEIDGQAVANNMSMLLLPDDLFDLSSYVGQPVHGILGADVFRSLVVAVDSEKNTLTLHKPDRFRAPRGRRWVSLSLSMEGDRPYVHTEVTLNDSVQLPLKLVLDTGAGHALSLETGSDARLTLPPQRLRTHLGRGLSGDVHGFLGRVTGLKLGHYYVRSLVTSFPDEQAVRARTDVPRNGNLGFELLKRFDVIIDYPHNRLWLKPNGLYRDPFEHDMCGIELLAIGRNYRRYVVRQVELGSPADQAQLRPNDEIVSVNLRPAHEFTLTQLSRLLHSEDGRPIMLFVRRANGDLHVARMRLKRQI